MRLRDIKLGKDRRLYEDEHGVSPVIAVILMVAITVVMAAIVSSWSAGVKAPTAPTTVGLDITRSNTNITTVVTAIDPVSAAPLSSLSFRYWNGAAFTTDTYSSVDVGFTRTINTKSNTMKQFMVTATFKDGSKKVLYSREV